MTFTAELDPAVKAVIFARQRRRSITVCESPSNPTKSLAAHPEAGPPAMAKRSVSSYLRELMTADYCYQPRNLQSSLECLSLTIEEVMHIRSVLTKAELECLITDPELYSLVAKGK
ncbi:hypothetical protein CAPTEDRAFT_192301, partial [Capitella teleta]